MLKYEEEYVDGEPRWLHEQKKKSQTEAKKKRISLLDKLLGRLTIIRQRLLATDEADPDTQSALVDYFFKTARSKNA
ncbi:MAG TPA: hypothetical protein V6C86_05730 [Oculatellaceae cyanobacterium]